MAGFVTLEDFVETDFGREIVDETDTVADLRTEMLRRRRLPFREEDDAGR